MRDNCLTPIFLRLLQAALVLCLLPSLGCTLMTVGNRLGVEGDEIITGSVPAGPPLVGPEGVLSSPHPMQPPAELAKVSLPAYRIEPPDILRIDAIRMVPKPPYTIRSLDVLQISVLGAFEDAPIGGPFQVEPEGTVNLGPAYGAVRVAGLSVREAKLVITQQLRRVLNQPEVSVTLLTPAGQQEIAGEHLVGPDGTVNLGIYGSVYITGMTIDEARREIERHLSEHLDEPVISLDILAYNSKVYYIITEGAGLGDQLVRVPITGNETVLDAVAQIGGLSRVSSKKKIWIARPAPQGAGCDQNLIVNWDDITKGASTATNYQLLPGDRLFIAEDRLIAMDSNVAKIISPFERMFGFTLLGGQTIQVLQRFPGGFNTN